MMANILLANAPIREMKRWSSGMATAKTAVSITITNDMLHYSAVSLPVISTRTLRKII